MPRSSHLDRSERDQIAVLKAAGHGVVVMALILERRPFNLNRRRRSNLCGYAQFIPKTGSHFSDFALIAPSAVRSGGDPEAGRVLAEEWRRRCHDISPAGLFKHYPTRFASIAVYRAPDQIRWGVEFPVQHASKPRVGHILDPKAIDDLTANIVSLDRSVGD